MTKIEFEQSVDHDDLQQESPDAGDTGDAHIYIPLVISAVFTGPTVLSQSGVVTRCYFTVQAKRNSKTQKQWIKNVKWMQLWKV